MFKNIFVHWDVQYLKEGHQRAIEIPRVSINFMAKWALK